MAPSTRKSGLGSYVAKRDALEAEQNRNAHDDLRMDVGEPVTPSRTRSAKHGSKSSKRRTSNSELRNAQHVDDTRVNDPNRFYDTDVSQAGIASTAPSLQQDSVQDRDVQRNDAERHHPIEPSRAVAEQHTREDNFLGESLSEDSFETRHGMISDRGHTASLPEHAELPMLNNRNSLPHVKGDSYPGTTSGQPSIVDTNDAFNGDTTHFQQGADTRYSWNAPVTASSHTHRITSSTKHATGSAQPQIVRPVHTTNIADVGAGFQFAPAQKYAAAQNQARPNQSKPSSPAPTAMYNAHPHHLRQQLQASASQAVATGRDGDQRSLPPSHRQRFPVQQEPDRPIWNDHEQTRRPVLTPPTHAKPATNMDERNTYTESQNQNQHLQQYVVDTTSAEEPAVQLDYSAEQLLAMDFAALTEQPFDIDPNVDVNRSLTDLADKPLDEQLTAVAANSADLQADFFSDLNIDQWEEAGEWFLDRFRDLARKMMHARREKRKAAQEFEKSIDHRHEAVSKKRKLTEDALQQMRQSGGALLQGSPDKRRKTK
jgi:hypothetical protein